MIRKDVLVKRPEGTKIYRQRNCEYVYHVTGSEYKKDKQYVVEKRVCIGKMVDDENMNPNDSFYQYYEMVGGNDEEAPAFSDALQVGASTLIFKVMEELKISELLESIHGETDANLIKDLVSYMIIRQTSTMQHYSDFVWGHLVNSEKKWDDTKISDFFKNAVDYAQTELFVSKWNEIQPEHSEIYISYDSTNMNIKAEGVDMAEYGHAKEDSDIPQVNISYAVNHKDATPLFYEMYPGSIIDNTQCTQMVDRAKEYGYKNVGLILDRGDFSIKNIRYFDAKGYDFLMMIKNNSILVRDMLKEAKLPLLILTKAKYYLPEHDVYGLTKQGTIGDDITVRYFHIYYDNVRASQEKNIYKNADDPYEYIEFYDDVWGDMQKYTGDGINFDTLTRYEQSLVNYPRIGSYVYFASSSSKEYHSTKQCYSLLKSNPVSRPASQRHNYNPCSKCVKQ